MVQAPAFEFVDNERKYLLMDALYNSELAFKKLLTTLPVIGNPNMTQNVTKLRKAKDRALNTSDKSGPEVKYKSYLFESTQLDKAKALMT